MLFAILARRGRLDLGRESGTHGCPHRLHGERRMALSLELRARVQAQEHAGRLVFVGEAPSVPLTSATSETKGTPQREAVDAANPAQDVNRAQVQVKSISHSPESKIDSHSQE